MSVGAACLALGYSVTLVWIAQSTLGVIDSVVDLIMTGEAGRIGYEEIKNKVIEVRAAETKARSQHSRIAGLFL